MKINYKGQELDVSTEAAQVFGALERDATESAAVAAGYAARRTGNSESVQVAASTKDALEAFAVEKDAKVRARIFARDIEPVLLRKTGEKISLIKGAGMEIMQLARNSAKIQASNSLGTLSGSLIAQTSLPLLKWKLPFLKGLGTDFSNASARLNQAIITRTRNTLPTVGDYDPVAGYVSTGATDVDVTVTINKHRYVQIEYNANELASTGRDLFGEQVEACTYALAKDFVDSIFALLTTTNFSLTAQKTVQALSGFSRVTVKSMGRAMTTRGNGKENRSLLLGGTYYDQLGEDAAMLALAEFQNPDIIRENVVGRAAGFETFEAATLPTTGNLVGFGMTPGALILATRLPSDYTDALAGANYGSSSQITDPETNLTLMLVQYVDHNKGVSKFRLAVMYGSAVGDSNRGQLLVSA